MPYRFAIILVIADIEEMLSTLRTALTSGETETIGELIEAISAPLTGLGGERLDGERKKGMRKPERAPVGRRPTAIVQRSKNTID